MAADHAVITESTGPTPLSLSSPAAVTHGPARLPRGPVLGWSSFGGQAAAGVPGICDLPYQLLTSSGRASLYAALRQLQLPTGSAVLVPSYHCPTMVAPVLCAGLVPLFFAIGDDGLPRLDLIDAGQRAKARAMIVAHYFGLPRSLRGVRRWCDEAGMVLIEDCAHSLFGSAEGEPVGSWGQYATASVSKFLPVPELGLLASSLPLPLHTELVSPPLRAQFKGVVDVFETASAFGRPAGLSLGLKALFSLKNHGREHPDPTAASDAPVGSSAASLMQACDMPRIEQAPLALSRWLYRALPLARVVRRRQLNYDRYAELLHGLQGTRFLRADRPADAAPYVFPLWVQEGDRVYHRLRALGMPVFRWDRVWPGTPNSRHDEGLRWSQHVLQLLCHQDLSRADIGQVAEQVRQAVDERPSR